jgi:putative endonuclease
MRSFVYMLACLTPRGVLTYVGWTLDPERRLAEHNSGRGAKSTRGRVWEIVHLEQHETRREAMSREWHLKRDRKLRRRLADAWLGRTGATA